MLSAGFLLPFTAYAETTPECQHKVDRRYQLVVKSFDGTAAKVSKTSWDRIKVELPTEAFVTNSPRPQNGYLQRVAKLGKIMSRHFPESRVVVSGYAHSSEKNGAGISEKRARIIDSQLRKTGMKATHVRYSGRSAPGANGTTFIIYGQAHPSCPLQ